MTLKIYYTGDLIIPDGSDTGVYGDPCEEGCGEDMQTGWVDPDWTLWTVYEERESVRPDEWQPDDGAMIDWLYGRLSDRLGLIEEDTGHGTYYAREDVDDFPTGKRIHLAAHVEGATEPMLACVGYMLARERRRYGLR